MLSHEEIGQQHRCTQNNEATATAFVAEHSAAGMASTGQQKHTQGPQTHHQVDSERIRLDRSTFGILSKAENPDHLRFISADVIQKACVIKSEFSNSEFHFIIQQ